MSKPKRAANRAYSTGKVSRYRVKKIVGALDEGLGLLDNAITDSLVEVEALDTKDPRKTLLVDMLVEMARMKAKLDRETTSIELLA